ncbi:hypothetical protein SAMN02746041_02409 [Desulfacinum hydrothermale DSM 13146]|uniref:Uncharacterized protein n=1 Tax=Desulfacinum hydrothermale DSM 13146 TaxID=1121390 RepID=A0A1W1XP85_9BACT|nr:hypothetical protein [Desulfacinum hydrothermale]SMC25665.1 hypothetical protein SAMN02746041_02409 [Desulfacinum hydrothermale DSM 13146]
MRKKWVLLLCLAAVLIPGLTAHAGCLTLTAPNGGERLVPGSVYHITWTNDCSKPLKIELRRNGIFLGFIARNVPPSQTSFRWTVGSHSGGTASIGSDYKILIMTEDGISWDRSETPFTLMQINPSAKVAAPPKMKARRVKRIDLKLIRVYSDSCVPPGGTPHNADAFYMHKIIATVGAAGPQLLRLVPEFRIRVAYYDAHSGHARRFTKDFKPESMGTVEVSNTPIVAKKSAGIAVSVVPLGGYGDPDLANNSIVLHQCTTYSSQDAMHDALETLTNPPGN